MPTIVKVWDLPVRIFHWLLVIAFVIAYITEEDFLTLHVWAGYLIIFLLLFRLIWGFIGNEYAQFKNFLCSPITSFTYLKQLLARKNKRYIGHNPAGSAMILMLLTSILATCLTGLVMLEVISVPQGAKLGSDFISWIIQSGNGESVEEIHEFFANFSVFLVLIHIAGVIFESILHKENLARAMLTGEKRVENVQSDDPE
jgi:cytochrome b